MTRSFNRKRYAAGRVAPTVGLAMGAVAAVVWCGSAPAGAAKPLPRVLSSCTVPGSIKPSQIVVACGDGNASAIKLHWSHWTAKGATGTGALSQDSCSPNCASGKNIVYPARVSLTNVVTAAGVPYFIRLTMAFGSKHPPGIRTATIYQCYGSPKSKAQPKCPVGTLPGFS